MSEQLREFPQKIPLLALRGLVLFPNMVLHFDVGRQKSMMALNDVMGKNRKILLVAQKDVIDQEIFLLREQTNNMNLQLQTYNLLIAEKQNELDAARARYDQLSAQNKDRIRAMEMYGELSYLSVLAQASSFGDLLDRISMVAEIHEADKRRMKDLDAAAKEVEQAQALLAEEKAALEQAREELALTQAELQTKRQDQSPQRNAAVR